MNLNKVIISGCVSQAPELRTTPSGQSVATMGVATNRTWTDKAGAKHGLVRVVDEMGEDYLFPEEYFVSLRLPQAVERAVLRASP